MIELSGYTGKSANSVRDRIIASNEMKSNKPAVLKKYRVKYSTQTLVTGRAFSLINKGTVAKKTFEVEVNSKDDFESFICGILNGKHKNPKHLRNGNKITIFSKLGSENFYVDIVEFH